MLRIGLDNVSPGRATGRMAPGSFRMYLQNVLGEMARQAPQHEFVLFSPDWADPPLATTPPNVRLVSLPGVPVNRPLRTLYQQTALAAAINRAQVDVFLATATVAPLRVRVPVVLVVHFIQFYEMPWAYGWVRSAYLRLMLPLSLRKARRVIIPTEAARRDLVRFTGVPAGKVAVVAHGLAPELQRCAEAALAEQAALINQVAPNSSLEPDGDARPHGAARPHGVAHPLAHLTGGRPFVLYVSATYTYKNHFRLIRAFGRLKRCHNLPHALVLVGAEADVSFAALRAEAERAGVAHDVILTGHIHGPPGQVYQAAAVSVMPSLHETFGFPVLEAMALGCPVLTSNLGAMAEVAGDAALLVDPLDEAALADGLARLLTDAGLRRALAERGRARAAAFTWARAGAETLRLLEAAARP